MSKKKPEAKAAPGPKAPFNPAFAGLAALRSEMPETAPTAPPPVEAPPKSKKKIVLARERKGHGGKTVTRVRLLELRPAELTELTQELKRNLGCGATVEDGEILLHGDQATRAARWLESKLGRPVIIGS